MVFLGIYTNIFCIEKHYMCFKDFTSYHIFSHILRKLFLQVYPATPFDPDITPGGDLIVCNITSTGDASDLFFISSDGKCRGYHFLQKGVPNIEGSFTISGCTATPFEPDITPGGDLIACNITSSGDGSDLFFISSDGKSGVRRLCEITK